MILIDDKSCYYWMRFFKTKKEVTKCIKEWHVLIVNQFGTNIKWMYSNNGGEYINNKLMQFFHLHNTTASHTLQHNGMTEQKNCFLVTMTRCMLLCASLSEMFWTEVVVLTNDIANAGPTNTLDSVTSVKSLTKKKLFVACFRVFGCCTNSGRALKEICSKSQVVNVLRVWGWQWINYRILYCVRLYIIEMLNFLKNELFWSRVLRILSPTIQIRCYG